MSFVAYYYFSQITYQIFIYLTILGRSSKIERQDVTDVPLTQNQSQIQAPNHSHIMSPQRTSSVASSASSKRISSSISVQLPAAGLGSRPTSIISTSTSLDEGGFNEPSPEIKAKLKPAYDFEVPNGRNVSSGIGTVGAAADVDECDRSRSMPTAEQIEKPSLNYVDVGYRLNPDGSESHEVFGESELYDTAKVTEMHKKFHANGFAQETTTVYATIKTEVTTAVELYYPDGKLAKERERVSGVLQSPTKSIGSGGSPVKSATISSPPVGVVSPIRRRSSDVSVKSTPPMSPTSIGSGSGGSCSGTATTNSTSNTRSISSIAIAAVANTSGKGVAPIASLDTQEEFDSSELPALPERPPPLTSACSTTVTAAITAATAGGVDGDAEYCALDLQDLEYADSSAGEDEDDLMRVIEEDDDDDVQVDACEAPLATVAEEDEEDKLMITTVAVEEVAIPREDSLPDAMTADEAEQLLSSR